MIELRDYQHDISDRAAEILRKYRMVYLSMQVRTGKTFTAFGTLQKIGADRCLFVTKKKAIVSIQKDAEAIGFNATVTNYESLHKVKERFKYIVVDEAHCCFVGNTIVDGIKIKDVNVGDSLNTFNFASGTVERKRVLAVIKKPLTERIVKIKSDGKEIVCTESHEIFTRNGWKRARDITPEDEVCTRWVREQFNPVTGI